MHKSNSCVFFIVYVIPFHSFQEISTHHKGTTENAPEETMHKKEKVTAKRLLSCTVEDVNCTS